MKRIPVVILSLLLVTLSTSAGAATVEDYSGVINDFRKSPVVAQFFNSAYGYAVYPNIGKAGYIIGGSYGKGQVYRNGMVVGTTSVIEGSIGFQIGGQAFSEIIFFEDERAYAKFTSGEFEFDATAQAVVVTAGASAQAGTTGASAGAGTGLDKGVQAEMGYLNGMAPFVIIRGGLMYELSLGGQKFTFQAL